MGRTIRERGAHTETQLCEYPCNLAVLVYGLIYEVVHAVPTASSNVCQRSERGPLFRCAWYACDNNGGASLDVVV